MRIFTLAPYAAVLALFAACGGPSEKQPARAAVAQALPRPQAPAATGPPRILFVGNSHTEYYASIPQLLRELCAFNHVPLREDKLVEMGIALNEIYATDQARAETLLAQADPDGNYYDYVVLQEKTPVAVDSAARYYADVRLWTTKLRSHSPGAAVLIYQLVAYENYPADSAAFRQSHDSTRAHALAAVRQTPNSGLYRVGDAVRAAYQGQHGYQFRQGPQDLLRYGESAESTLHLRNDGAFLAAVLLYETLFGRRPQLPAQLTLSTGPGEEDQPAALPVRTAISNPDALAATAWQYH